MLFLYYIRKWFALFFARMRYTIVSQSKFTHVDTWTGSLNNKKNYTMNFVSTVNASHCIASMACFESNKLPFSTIIYAKIRFQWINRVRMVRVHRTFGSRASVTASRRSCLHQTNVLLRIQSVFVHTIIMVTNPQFAQMRIIEMYLILDAFADNTFTIATHHVRAIDGFLNIHRRPARLRLWRWHRIHKNVNTIFCFRTQNGRLVQFVRNDVNGTEDLGFTHTILMTMTTAINLDVGVGDILVEILNWCFHLFVSLLSPPPSQTLEFNK